MNVQFENKEAVEGLFTSRSKTNVPLETVYVSDLLKRKSPKTYQLLEEALNSNGVLLEELIGTKDIWVRDFMPVKVDPDSHVQFQYNPSYLKGYKDLVTEPRNCYPKGLKPKMAELILDGGNVVMSENSVILTRAVFSENRHLSERDIANKLLDYFNKMSVAIVPKEPEDLFGHSDGMLRFLNAETVMVNDFKSAGAGKSFVDKLFGQLSRVGLNVLLCPYAPEDRITKYGVPSAVGNYINFLETKNVLFVPQYNIESDKKALEFFKTYHHKKVVGIDCRDIAEHGGVLNCITWNEFY